MLLEERKMDQVDVEMQDVELVAPLVQLVQHRQMGREVGLERAGIEPDGLVAHRHERGPGPRLGTGEQRHLVAELDQGVGEVGDDPFRAAVEAGRDRLVERRDLGNLHKAPSMALTSCAAGRCCRPGSQIVAASAAASRVSACSSSFGSTSRPWVEPPGRPREP